MDLSSWSSGTRGGSTFDGKQEVEPLLTLQVCSVRVRVELQSLLSGFYFPGNNNNRSREEKENFTEPKSHDVRGGFLAVFFFSPEIIKRKL